MYKLIYADASGEQFAEKIFFRPVCVWPSRAGRNRSGPDRSCRERSGLIGSGGVDRVGSNRVR